MDPKALVSAARALKDAQALLGSLQRARDAESSWPELAAGARTLATLLDKARLAEVEAELRAELTALQGSIEPARARYRTAFGRDLAAALQPLGFELGGQYPTFRAGVFTLQVDAEHDRATVSFGPDEVARERPSPTRLVAALDAWRRDVLDRPLDPDALLGSLQVAWKRALRNAPRPSGDVRAPILDVLAELNLVVQGEAFRADPSARTFRPVTRHAFAWDLFRLRSQRHLAAGGLRLVLHTAVYDDTRTRRDHLWVPDDERGAGTRVARLSFQEETA
jgi:hypothetical protein